MAKQSKYDINKIRKQVKEKVGKHTDPTEFRPPKAEDGKPPIKFRFYVLPPFEEGDELATGQAEKGMTEFFVRNGAHFMDNKKLGCPRVIADEDCGICTHGFDLMSETDDKKRRSAIASRLLPGTYYAVNIYFPAIKPNPPDLQGKVKWYNCPKTVFDMFEDCLFRDDDGGDPAEPLPYGVFYDEDDAYLFQLEVKKEGQQNSYKTSKFMVSESMSSRPIAGKPNAPDEKKIAEILAQRHDLFDKIPDVDTAAVERVAKNLTGGDDDEESGGFDEDETKAEEDKAAARKAKEQARKDKKKGKGIKPPVSESSKKKEEKAPEEPEADDDLAGLADDAEEEPSDDDAADVSGEVPVDDDEAPFDADEGEEESSGDDDDVDDLLRQLEDND